MMAASWRPGVVTYFVCPPELMLYGPVRMTTPVLRAGPGPSSATSTTPGLGEDLEAALKVHDLRRGPIPACRSTLRGRPRYRMAAFPPRVMRHGERLGVS